MTQARDKHDTAQQPQWKTHLYATCLLICLGFIWGSGYSIAHYATTHQVPALGYAFWQSLGPCLFLLLLSWFMPQHRLQLSPQHIVFYAFTGLFGIVIPNSVMYFAAAQLPAGLLAVVINTVPIFTYMIALSYAEEHFQWQRLAGVFVCFMGIIMLTGFIQHWPRIHGIPWIIISLIAPISFALTAVYSSLNKPNNITPYMSATGMLIFSTVYLSPIMFFTHTFYHFGLPWHMRDTAIILEIILSSVGYIIFFRLLFQAGAVYYSLVGGLVAITGLWWGHMLFHEQFHIQTWLAIIAIITGITLVSIYKKKTY